jgi:2-phosphoglycerate kinase
VDTTGDALVILGASGIGKSTVGRYCALRWPAKRYVDVGMLRQMLRPQQPELVLSTYEAWRLAGDEPTPSNLALGFERYAAALWPAVCNLLEWVAEEGNNLVMDGVMLSPRLIAGFSLPNLRIRPCLLHLSDTDAHLKRLTSNMHPDSQQAKRLVGSFPRIRALQDYLTAECRALDIPIYENLVLEDTVEAILAAIVED